MESYARAPFHYLPPIERGDEPPLLTIVNSSGGIAGGDKLEMDVRLEAGAVLSLRTQGATRIYRSKGHCATSRCRFEVGEGAVLDYFPDEVIPFADSEYAQETEVDLAAGAAALLSEVVTAGRFARGESFAFRHLAIALRCTARGRLRLHERAELRTAEPFSDPAILGDATVWGTFHLLSAVPAPAELVESLDRAVRDIAEGCGGATLSPAGAVARVAGRSLDAVRGALGEARRLALGCSPCSP